MIRNTRKKAVWFNRGKVVFSFTLVLLLMANSRGQSVQGSSHISFTDVARTGGWGPAIHFVADVGWVSGYNTNPPCTTGIPCFKPTNSATRGQISKMIVNATGVALYNPPTPTFTDVPTTHTFYKEIETMNLYGWASGYNTNPPCTTGFPCFKPEETTTRGQFSKMLVKSMSNVRAWITPPSPTFTDVPTNHTYYTFVETSWAYFLIMDNGSSYGTYTFRVGDPIVRGDVAMALFHAKSLELNLGHNSRYAGSNNWDGPNTSCSPTAGGGQPTFLSGVEVGHSTNYGRYTSFRPMGREILFDTDAKNYLACNPTYKLAIVYHANDFFGSGTGCQDGSYASNAYTSLPPPVGLDIKSACVQFWGPDNSEARIYTSSPANLLANSAQYFATIEWAPNDFGAVNDGQINIDNYQLDASRNKLYNDNMQKFCYTKGSASTGQTGNKFGIFPCP